MRNNRAMEKKKPTPKKPTTTVRLPPPLHEDVKEGALRNAHSMNDEIILRLRLQPIESRLAELEQQNAEMKRMLQHLIDRQT